MTARVAFVVPDYEPLVGGTTRQAGYQARELVARGHDVVIVTRRVERSLPRREVRDGVPIVRLGPTGRGAAAEKAALLATAAWLARHRRSLDVVQILMQGDLALAARLAGVSSRTCVTWAGLGDASDLLAPDNRSTFHRLQWQYRRGALQRCRHVALSPPIADELRRCGLTVHAEIPVPVDLSRFRPPTADERAEARRAIGASGEEPVIVYVGHLRRLKAVDRLVEAFARMPTGRLVLVGGGRGAPDDTESELRDQVASLGLTERVRFAGSVGDVRPFLWAADVFVLPSEREGMPNTLLEAMACGVPCVAPASAGGDVLLGEGAGLVPPSNAADDLHRAIARAVEDSELRSAIIAQAADRVTAFSIRHVVESYELLYEEVARDLG